MERNERKNTFIEIAGLVEKAGSLYSKYLLNPTETSYYEQIEQIEREGDNLQDKLNVYYTSQKNIPYLSLDRAKLLSRLDEILDQILLGSKTIETYGTSLPKDFVDHEQQLSEEVEMITKMISKAVNVIYESFTEAAKITNEIELIRDRATDQLFELEKIYFHREDAAENWKSYMALSRITRRTMGVINAAKSASEMIQIMTMKYL